MIGKISLASPSWMTIILLVFQIRICECRPINLQRRSADSQEDGNVNITACTNYLRRYSYLPYPFDGESDTAEDLAHAVKAFQQMAGINQTGVIDSLTEQMMQAPRCGVSDAINYRIGWNRWYKSDLTYRIKNCPKTMGVNNMAIVRHTMAYAFQMYSNVSSLSFTEVTDRDIHVDINVRFEYNDHGDGANFDGPGGTLAHAFLPPQGELHFDASESWSLQSWYGHDLLQVAVHEIGHILGVLHSQNVDSIMHPFYKEGRCMEGLHQDDIDAIQMLYGPPPSTKQPTTAPDTTTNTQETTTELATTDTMPSTPTDELQTSISDTRSTSVKVPQPSSHSTSSQDKTLTSGPASYSPSTVTVPQVSTRPASSEDKTLASDPTTNTRSTVTVPQASTHPASSEDKTFASYPTTNPQSMASTLQPLPLVHLTSDDSMLLVLACRRDFDAVVTVPGKGTLAFSGEFLWRLDMTDAMPLKIVDVYPDIPNNIDGAFSVQDKTYFFKDTQFWRFHLSTLDPGYPKQITSTWRELPSQIDSVYQDQRDNTLYFFQGKKFYQYQGTYLLHIGEIGTGITTGLTAPVQAISHMIDEEGFELGSFAFQGNSYYRLVTRETREEGQFWRRDGFITSRWLTRCSEIDDIMHLIG